MTHIADLAPCNDLRLDAAKVPVLAVGWLDDAHPYTRGSVDRDDFDTLISLLANPWQPFVSAGRHACPFCRFSGGPARVGEVTMGSANLFVPAEACVYVAPSLILHYIDAHGYAPPDAFWEAVRACPPMRSMAYLKRVAVLGLTRRGI